MNSTLFPTLRQQLTTLLTRLKIGRALALVLSLTAAMVSPPSLAQPGTPDILDFGPYPNLAYGEFPPIANHFFTLHDAIVLPNDRVVAGGTCTAVPANTATPGNRFCLAVWSLNGLAVDLYVHSSPVNRVSASAGGAIAAQRDGKIVVTAPCRYSATAGSVNQFCAVRFNADFTSDTGFASGYQNTSPSPSTNSDSYANAIAIQPDGKIVVAGQCGNASGTAFCAARLLPDGNPDATFGGANSLRSFAGVHSTAPFDRVKRVALAPNGQIYLGGDCKQSSGFTLACVARLNADGSIDNGLLPVASTPLSFTAIGNGSSNETIYDMVVQANGEFIFAGDCKNPSSTVLVPCALRLGAPDGTQFFSGTNYNGATSPSGSYTLREPATAGAFSIVAAYLQPDGKMLALLKDGSSNSSFRVRRYNEDGSIDANWDQPAFDFNAATDNASGFAKGFALAQQRSGRVIAMGYTQSFSTQNPQARVIRFNNRGNPGRNCSSDIDGDGKVLPTTDGLLLARVAAGMTGNAVISGAVGAGAPRNTWPRIRDYLITQCGMVVAP